MSDPFEPLHSTHAAEFLHWTRRASDPEHEPWQAPVDELLGEHHLVKGVMLAMETEARDAELRGAEKSRFWNDVAEFLLDFVHYCHRSKEEMVFFPAMRRGNLIENDASDRLQDDHTRAKEITIEFVEAVRREAWQEVPAIVHRYVAFVRAHIHREEQELMQPWLRNLGPEKDRELARAFADVEASALKGNGRGHYLDLARRLVEAAHVPYPVDPSGS